MRQVLIRCSDAEAQRLKQYCAQTERSQNDVLRELIRKLKIKNKKSPF
ncbi:ribbon-helix-helix protein, CopG family [Coleofasciculus sp.]